MRFGMFPEQITEGLLRVRAFERLQVVQKYRVTGNIQLWLRRIGQGVPPADGVRFQQNRSRGAFAAAARGAEQDHLPLSPCCLEFFLERRR